MTLEIDHQGLAISRLVTQFKESPNLIAYIRELLSEANAVEDVNQQLLEERWVDTAIGAQLDILGDIVGQLRAFSIAPTQEFFGFDGSIGAGTFGTEGDANIGVEFFSLSSVEYGEGEFDDETYRIMIRAKIRKNRTDCTIEDVIAIIIEGLQSATKVIITGPEIIQRFGFKETVEGGPFDSLSGVAEANVFKSESELEIVGGYAAFKCTFPTFLNNFDKALLTKTDFTPKPAGVSVTYADNNGDFS